jgi:ferrous iron transport protein B
MLFTLVYTPCLSTIATLRSEAKDMRYTLFTLGWSLALAWAISFVFYQSARALGY